MLITRLLLVLEVWDGKPTYRKSLAVNVFVWLDLILTPSSRSSEGIKRPARDACLCMGELPAPPAPHFVFLITL